MLNTLNINLKTDIKNDRPTALGIKLMSQDKNNNQFILRFTNGGEPVTLDDTYTVEILTKFSNSGASRLTSATVRQDYATWQFDTEYITQDETVYNYVYVRKAGSLVVSADANAFYFDVGLSEIDKDAGRVAEVYDENYQKYLDEFKENVDFEEIAQAEQARKEAEILRQESYEAKVDTAIVEADVVEKVDNKVTELTPQINDLTAQLAQTDGRIDTILVSGTPTEGNTILIDGAVSASGENHGTVGTNIRKTQTGEAIVDDGVTSPKVNENVMHRLQLSLGSPEALEKLVTEASFQDYDTGTSVLDKSLSFPKMLEGRAMMVLDVRPKTSTLNSILTIGENINFIVKVSEPSPYLTIRFRDAINVQDATNVVTGDYLGGGYYTINNYPVARDVAHRLIFTNLLDIPITIEKLYISSKEMPVRGMLGELVNEAVEKSRHSMNKNDILNMGSIKKLEDNLQIFHRLDQNSSPVSATVGEVLPASSIFYYDLNMLGDSQNGVLTYTGKINMIVKIETPLEDYDLVEVKLRNNQNNDVDATNIAYGEHIGDGYYAIYDYPIVENRIHRVLIRNKGGSDKTVGEIYLSDNGNPIRGVFVDELQQALSGGDGKVIRYVSPTGLDTNTGLSKGSPLLTFQKALDDGANVIYAKPGDYIGQTIQASNLPYLEIRGYADGVVGPFKEKATAKLTNAHALNVANDTATGLLKGSLTVDNGSLWYKVFIEKSIPIIKEDAYVTNPKMTTYNAILWEVNNPKGVALTELKDDLKLIPVLTLAEAMDTQGSFFFDGSHIYINPNKGVSSGKTFMKMTNDNLPFPLFSNIGVLRVSDVDFLYQCSRSCEIQRVEDYLFQHCTFGYTAWGTGFRPGSSNGKNVKCYAYQNQTDGFAPVGNGDMHFFDCEGMYNGDDGISHHDNSTGSINGGEYHHNPKGGVSPAHGARVDVYNVISHNNGFGFYCEAAAGTIVGREVKHVGNVAYDNTRGISVKNYHVKSFNCKYENNTTPIQIVETNGDTSLIEL